jgi:hypothetical protein
MKDNIEAKRDAAIEKVFSYWNALGFEWEEEV